MTLGLTPRLQELASFIRSYLAANDGIGPTHDEMKAAIGLKSKSGVARMVNELEERGVITRKKYGSRSIMIKDDDTDRAGLVRYAQSLEQHNDKLQSSLRKIIGWIDGQEGAEQIPPQYLIEAHSLLNREE